jgi:hypothetical protein
MVPIFSVQSEKWQVINKYCKLLKNLEYLVIFWSEKEKKNHINLIKSISEPGEVWK